MDLQRALFELHVGFFLEHRAAGNRLLQLSLCFLDLLLRGVLALLDADCFLHVEQLVKCPAVADFPGSDGPTLLRSIREQLLPLPDDYAVYPGHGPATTIGRERRSNPYLQAGAEYLFES